MRRASTLALAFAALACGGEASPSGLSEPLRVQGAVFKHGELPGNASLDGDAGDDERSGPAVLSISTDSTAVRPGRAGLPLRGSATDDGYAIALRFADLGSGYWVKPLGGPSDLPGQLTWNLALDFGADVPPGHQELQFVALDADGQPGPQSAFELCVTRDVESSLNACDPSKLPPAAVVALTWDVDADLDLVLVTPAGKTVDARHPSTVVPDDPGAFDRDAPGVGVLEPDSNPGCHVDSLRRETVTWNTSPEPGEYRVFANVFEGCGKQAVHFTLQAYVRTRGDEPDTYSFAELGEATYGVLLGASANGGRQNGTFVTAIEFP
jgi:hypothetical protein